MLVVLTLMTSRPQGSMRADFGVRIFRHGDVAPVVVTDRPRIRSARITTGWRSSISQNASLLGKRMHTGAGSPCSCAADS
jgi:hypothetical protein